MAPDPALAAFETLFGPEFGHGKRFDLARLRQVLDALGVRQQELAPIVHVAGTNGKGSTIAFMRAIAEAAGQRVHAFTKPHLFQLSERFVLAGVQARDDVLIAAAERIAAVDRELSQFDAQVAAALLLFSERQADLALIETGMGGRDDSTNVLLAPALSVITPIGLDHQDALGADLPEIAAHKAGIMRANVPAIIARQAEAARTVIEARAAEVGAPLMRQGVEWDAFLSAGRLVVQTQSRVLDLPTPALHGAHQIDNAGLAAAALLHWRDLDDAAFAAGVTQVRWPGRLQPMTRGRFSAPIRALGGEVWVDGAHNAHAAAALAHALQAMGKRRALPVTVILAQRARKDASAFLAALAPAISEIIAVPLREAHVSVDDIAASARGFGVQARTAASLSEAMLLAAHAPACRVLICGSLALAAEALALEGA